MRWVAIICMGLALAAGFVAALRHDPAPQPLVNSPRERVEVSRCEECHAEVVEQFAEAPHRITLRPGSSPELLPRFAGGRHDVFGHALRFEETSDGKLEIATDRFPHPVTVDWFFGSGQHAVTPVSLQAGPAGETELVQLNVSWYADGELGVTPGSNEADPESSVLGLYHSGPETRRCFGCHTSHLPVEKGAIDFSRMEAGIRCSRCHPQAGAHVASDGDQPTANPWRTLTPRQSIQLCGECHRRVDEFTPDEISPDAEHLIRFAPVGLSQSRCFLGSRPDATDSEQARSPRRMDCVTCHDPHSPAQKDPRFYVKRCLQCHGTSHEDAPVCADQPMTSQCLQCHMPQREVLPHLSFTDHWIRVGSGESNE